ncbi:hypothetical protein D9611_003923 [Ephemerocybe angulata]|uniref:RanBD1 domain-containing protein n=1 Tax=Ephemerocybe angulata TaxID=980116 RepID=A0A8H5B667_9AGAR|nr:hypothetical protein D9611_003923 [Tulosesus angulatus]
MKRVADKQLIKDGDEGDEEDVGRGFRKADESVLATRKIRGLPKRNGLSAAPSAPAPAMTWNPTPTSAPTEKEEAPVSKFAGFAGFGAAKPSAPPSVFGNAAASAAPAFTPAPAAPSTTTGASNAAKTFANFLGTTGTTNGTASKPAATATSSEPTEDKDAVDYYTSLRGLNVSFLKTINENLEKDPFADMSELLSRYHSLRSGIQKDFDSKKGAAPKTTTNATALVPSTEPMFRTQVMPVPPSGIASPFKPSNSHASPFGIPPPKPEPKPPAAFEFKPAPTSTSSPFAIPIPSSKPKEELPSFSFGSSSATKPKEDAPAPAPAFSFGVSSSSQAAAPSNGGFTFGGPKATSSNALSSAPVPFSFGAPPKATAPASSLPFTLSKPKEEEKETEAPAASSTASSIFGTSSSTASSSPFGTFGSKPTSGSAFTFGAPSSTSTFDGGSSSSTFGGGASGFSFGGGGSTSAIASSDKKEAAAEDAGAQAEGSTSADNAADGAAPLHPMGVNPHDTEGEGEEDEETVHAIKGKAFRMKKAGEQGGPGWAELGAGIVRLKKHKETDARRMLLRNSSNGKININFSLYSGLKPSVAKKAVTFIGHDKGVAQTYSIRVPTEENAKDLKEALEREIAFVKAKEDA